MFSWLTKDLVRLVVKLFFSIALAAAFWVSEYQAAMVYAIMLVYFEVEELNEKADES